MSFSFLLQPKGALTAKPYAFRVRPWELSSVESIDLIDHFQNEIYIQYKNNTITRILPKKTKKNNSFISDSTRFSFDAISFNRTRLKKNSSVSYKYVRGLNLKNLIVVDKSLDLKILNFLKTLSYSTNNLYLRSEYKTISSSSFYVWSPKSNLSTFENTSKSCVICSTILNVESLILNIKIRLKFNKKRLTIFKFGYFSNSNFETTFLSLKLVKFLDLIKQKHLIFLKSSFILKNSIFIVGESFLRRFKEFSSVLNLLKQKNKTILFYFILKNPTADSTRFHSIKTVSKRFLNRLDKVIFVNLEDTVQSLSYLNSNNSKYKNILSFSSYNTQISKNSKLILPIPSLFEFSGLYINVEQNLKKSLCVSIVTSNSLQSCFFKFLSTFSILKPFFIKFGCLKQKIKSTNCFSFVALEFLKNSSLFNKNSKLFFPGWLKNTFVLFSYPDKTIYEDRFRFNLNTKNSLTMLECSRNDRKQIHNFS